MTTFPKRAALAVALGVFALLGGACSNGAPVDQIGLYYSGGPLQGTHFEKIIEPGSGAVFTGIFDSIKWLPAGQRNYIVSLDPGEGDRKTKDSIVTPAKGGVNMTFEIAVFFKLNTHPTVVRTFYEQICKKYDCTSDGGWDRMLNDNFRKVIETSMRQKTFSYTVDELWANQEGEVTDFYSVVGWPADTDAILAACTPDKARMVRIERTGGDL